MTFATLITEPSPPFSILKSPVILQTTPSTVKYASLDYFYANAKVAAQKASVPVAIHLDHGNSFELAI